MEAMYTSEHSEQNGTARHGTARHGTTRHGTVQYKENKGRKTDEDAGT